MPDIDSHHIYSHIARLAMREPLGPLPPFSVVPQVDRDIVVGYGFAALKHSWNLIERLRVCAEKTGDPEALRQLKVFDAMMCGNRAIAAAYEADEKSAHQQKDIIES